MNYITTTDLRTKASKLKDSLARGESTYVLHRSQIIGVFEPYESNDKTFSLKKLNKLHKAIPVSKIEYGYNERKRNYARHLKGKYGQSVS